MTRKWTQPTNAGRSEQQPWVVPRSLSRQLRCVPKSEWPTTATSSADEMLQTGSGASVESRNLPVAEAAESFERCLREGTRSACGCDRWCCASKRRRKGRPALSRTEGAICGQWPRGCPSSGQFRGRPRNSVTRSKTRSNKTFSDEEVFFDSGSTVDSRRVCKNRRQSPW